MIREAEIRHLDSNDAYIMLIRIAYTTVILICPMLILRERAVTTSLFAAPRDEGEIAGGGKRAGAPTHRHARTQISAADPECQQLRGPWLKIARPQ